MILVLLAATTALTFDTPQKPQTLKQLSKELATASAGDADLATPAVLPGVGAEGSFYNYCEATPNSFGKAAAITCGGSLDLAAEATFHLVATEVPPVPSSFGMFTYGQVQTHTPFANGYLCISPFNPGIFRFTPQSLGAGVVQATLAEHPEEFVQFLPGSSWNFQFWYRDPAAGGARFNLSNGLHVDFAPSL